MQTVSFAELGVFAACLIVILGVAVMVKQLVTRTPPLHQEYASKEAHEALAAKMDQELGRERGSRKKMHEEIAELQGAVEVVKNQNAAQSEQLTDLRSDQSKLRDRMDEIPKRTIDLLRSSGALK